MQSGLSYGAPVGADLREDIFHGSSGRADPPVPALKVTKPQVREMLMEGREMAFQHRFAPTNRVLAEGTKSLRGQSELLPLDPE